MKKLKLLFAALALFWGASSANAQTDVTSTYLTNANFATGTPIDNNVCTYGKDMTGNSTTYYGAQAISGWTNASVGVKDEQNYENSGLAGGLFAYGSNPWLAGSGNPAPATDPDNKTGNAVGLCAVWGNRVQYTQDVTLPAGGYTLVFKVYNATSGSGNSSGVITSDLFGFIAGSTTYYAPNNTFAIGQWSTIAVTFKLTEETAGKISMGYVGPGGGAAMPHLFVDNVKILRNVMQKDCTGKVNKSGWEGASDGYQGGDINTARKYGDKAEGQKIYQTVSGLDNGTYEVALYSISQKEWNGSLANDRGDVAYVFAGEGTHEIKEFINARARAAYPGDENVGIYTISGVQVTDGTLKLGMGLAQSDLTEWHHVQIKSLVRTYIDLSDLVSAYNTALTAAKNIDKTQKMTASVKTALNEAIDEYDTGKVDLEDGEAIQAATDALSMATTNANASIANYASLKAVIDECAVYAATYDEVGQAKYETESADAIEAYTNGTATDCNNEKAALKAALTTACKAQEQPADGAYMTPYIVNPNIDGNANGWTCTKLGNADGTGGPMKPSGDALEYWGVSATNDQAPNRNFNYFQTINNLPNGAYTIGADMFNSTNGETGANWNGGGKAGLYGKTISAEVKELITTDGDNYVPYTTDVIFVVDGKLTIGIKNVSTLTGRWFVADNFKLTYVRQLTEDEVVNTERANAFALFSEALGEAQHVDQTKPMNKEVLGTLTGAITNSDCISLDYPAEAITNAKNTLIAATNAANASITNYASLKAIIDANDPIVDTYDSDGKAAYSTASADAIAAYTNRTATDCKDEIAALKAALITACKAQTQPADGCDMSPWIVNANFDGSIDGWTVEKKGNGWTGNPYKDGTIEYWTGSTTDANSSGNFFDFYQSINSLPNGAYTISVDMMNSTNGEEGANWNGGENAGLYGKTASDEKRVLVKTDGATNNQVLANYTTELILVVDGNLRLGVKNINPLTGRWFVADNFKLTYVRQLTEEEKKVFAKADYDDAMAAAQAITEGSIPTAAFTAFSGVVSNNTLTEGTSAQYAAAAAAINQAVADATPLVAPYAAWKALKPQADALVAVSNNDDTANGTLNDAITAQSTAAEGATAAATITTATSTLKAAMVTYVTTAEPTNDECFDLTFMIENPHFTEGNGGTAIPTGWTLESGSISEHRLLTHNFEAYHKQFNLSQTITGLSKGTYKVTLQGFARHDDNGPTDKTNLYCGIVNQKIKDIKDEYSTTNWAASQPALGDNNGASSYQLGDQTVWQPNGMSGSYYFFQKTNPATNKPFYTNEVQTLITEPGDLTIGFKCETTSDWVIWDNFHLYYYGSAIDVTIDENKGVTFSENIENANVTLKRTFSTTNWNTFCVPFDIDNDALKDQFGDGVQVAEYSEDTDGSGDSSVDLKKMDTPAVTANVPVLILTPKTDNENTYTFNGVDIKAGEGEPKVEGAAIFDFVGTYAALTTIAEGDYFLASNKLYRSKGETTIKGTRAYIKAKEASATARIANFFIDGVNTTNIEGLVIEGAGTGKIYNLNGQEVKTPKKGLYIQNGKKISIK